MTVDESLEWCDKYLGRPASPSMPTDVLAAEVRRLREENEQALGWHADQVRMVQVLEAKLARVEALPEKWRDIATHEHWNCTHEWVANDLEEALRDQPTGT